MRPLQFGLLAFLLWLTGVCTGGIAYGLMIERALNAVDAELTQVKVQCASVAQSLQKCDSK